MDEQGAKKPTESHVITVNNHDCTMLNYQREYHKSITSISADSKVTADS